MKKHKIVLFKYVFDLQNAIYKNNNNYTTIQFKF